VKTAPLSGLLKRPVHLQLSLFLLEVAPTYRDSSIETRLCMIKQMAFAFPGQISNPDNGKRKAEFAERLDREIS
jgi:hypothetical protein